MEEAVKRKAVKDNDEVSVNLPENQELFSVFFNVTIEKDGIKAGCFAIATKVAENRYAIYHSNTSKNLKGKEYGDNTLALATTSKTLPYFLIFHLWEIIQKTGRTPDGIELKSGDRVTVRYGEYKLKRDYKPVHAA